MLLQFAMLHHPTVNDTANDNGEERAGWRSESNNDDSEHLHHLGSVGYRRDACHIAIATSDKQVGESVEYLQKVGEHIGQ